MDASTFIGGLTADQQDELRKALGDDSQHDNGFTADELDDVIYDLKKGMGGEPDWDGADAEAQVDVTGYLSEVVSSLQKGYSTVHDSQDTLAKGMVAIVDVLGSLRDDIADARAENAELRKSLRLPEPQRAVHTDYQRVANPPGERNSVIENMSVNEVTDRIFKAMDTESDPMRLDQMSKAITSIECGQPCGPNTLAELGIH